MAVALSGMTLYTNNDNETNWAGTDGADTYNVAIQGTNSESWLVSKNSTETGTLTLTPGTAPNATRGLAMMWMKSDLEYYYTDIKFELQSSAGNYKTFTVATSAAPDIGGRFTPIVLDYVNKGTATGTYAPASHTVTRVIVNNSASGNIRSVTNNWLDAFYFGAGHTISGTTVGDKLFAEAAAVDQNGTNEYGILENYNDIVYTQGDISLTGTALTSSGETLVFKDTTNGYDRYNFDITGTITFVNTAILSSGVVDYDMDTTGGTSFSMTGGSLTQGNQLTLISGNTLDNVVITDMNASSIANSPDSCTWNLSGLITLTGSLLGCTINKSTGASSISTTDLAKVNACNLISDGSNHGVELTSIGTGTMTWNTNTSGYQAGTAASPVTPTSTGNEDIYVNVATASDLTINVAAGATVPSIRVGASFTGSVNVVSSFTLTLTDIPSGVEVTIVNSTTRAELQHSTSTGTDILYPHGGSGTIDILLNSLAYDPNLSDIYDLPLSASDSSIKFQMIDDPNYANPA